MGYTEGGPQRELLTKLSEHIRIGEVCVLDQEEEEYCVSQYNQWYPESFPFEGATMHWAADPHDELKYPYPEWEISLLPEVQKLAGLPDHELVIAMWDDANYVSIRLPFEILVRFATSFMIPPHLYVFATDLRWCACWRMEGYVGFGFARQEP